LNFIIIILPITIILYITIWHIDVKKSLIISPIIIFEMFMIFGIYTGYSAYKTNITNNLNSLFINLIAFISTYLGFVLSDIRFIKSKRLIEFRNNYIQKFNHKKYLKIYLILVIFLLAIGIYVYNGFPPILNNIKQLIFGTLSDASALDASYQRYLLTKSYYFGENYRGQGLIRIFLKFGYSYLIIISYVNFREKKNKSWIVLFIISAILSLAFVAGDGTRGPILRVFMALLISSSIYKKEKISNLINILLIMLLIVIIISMTSTKMFFQSKESGNIILSSISSIMNRLLTGNQINDVYVIEFLKSGVLKYSFGKFHLVQFINQFPGVSSYKSFSYELSQLYGSGSGTTYMSPTYLSLAYTDFGIIGVILIYSLMGIIINYVSIKIFIKEKNSINISYLSLIILEMGLLPITGPIAIIPSIIVIYFYYALLKIFIK